MQQIDARDLHAVLRAHSIEQYYGVPDSLVSSLSFYLHDIHPKTHTIAANEGNAIGLAIGYHLAANKVPAVYMQNSGLSNALDPLASLVDKDVFHVPILLLVSWRGMPGVPDEPQHIRQGAITTQLLELLDIPFEVLSRDFEELRQQVARAAKHMEAHNTPYALLIEKDFFTPYGQPTSLSHAVMTREAAITSITSVLKPEDIIVSGIGKVSRELFEHREHAGQSHDRDVLVVGGMGHASSVALGIAQRQADKPTVCLDGDGAVRMHMGALSTIGASKAKNFIHIVFENGVHDSVGGQQLPNPTMSLEQIAAACGYASICSVSSEQGLRSAVEQSRETSGPHFIVVRVKPGARKNLGRPTIKPADNKQAVQDALRKTL